MHSIKITVFTCALLFSCASYSSAPAQLPFDPDELEIPKIHLIPKKVAHNELEQATKELRSFAKGSPHKDLVKKIHQAHCASEKHLASWQNAEQSIKNDGQQEIAQGLRDEVQTFKTLWKQQNQQWLNLTKQAKGNPGQLWDVFALENRQRNMYLAQAVLLRIKNEELIKEKEEGLQREQNMQIQLQQQAAQINQLRALLEQQEPGGQQIDVFGVASQVGRVRRSLGEGGRYGSAEREGMPHQLPFAPGGIK